MPARIPTAQPPPSLNGMPPLMPLSDSEKAEAQAAMMWLLQTAQEIHDAPIVINGKTFIFHYRKLLHGDLNSLGSEAWLHEQVKDEHGQTHVESTFRINFYFAACLKKMFMTEDLKHLQPFPLSPQVINSLSPEVGSQFQALIPDMNGSVTASKLQDLKKGSGESSQTEE